MNFKIILFFSILVITILMIKKVSDDKKIDFDDKKLRINLCVNFSQNFYARNFFWGEKIKSLNK